MQIEAQDKSKWYKWFAWHPVWAGNTFVWFEYTHRHWIPNASSSGDFSGYSSDVPGWEYALLGSLGECEASLDGISWEKISDKIVDTALANGYKIRSKTV